MELTITDLTLELSSENLTQVTQKTHHLFDKFCDNVQVIKIIIDDVNGPKGGKDKYCRVVIYSKGMPDIVITDNQTLVMSAVNIALSRARLSFLKKNKRKQKNYPSLTPKNNVELSQLIELERNGLSLN